MTTQRIVLLHATPLAMEPVRLAFEAHWPEAETVNLLDDSLSRDRARDGAMTEAMIERFASLCRYGHSLGAAGILATCSAFGPAIEHAARHLPIPVLRPNEAMFDAAFALGNRIGMIATFEPSIASMAEEFEEEAGRLGRDARLTTRLAKGAMDMLRLGDEPGHNRLIGEQAAAMAGVDAIMLAQFSMSGAAAAVRAAVTVPVLTSPETAVLKIRKAVTGKA